MKHFIIRVLAAMGILIPVASSNTALAQQVTKVGAGEYLTVYLMSNRTVRVSNQSTITPILTTYPGLDSVIDVQGGQYHVTALDEQGKVYKLSRLGTYVMTTNDEAGNAFTGNFQVRGFWQCNVSLRGADSSLWYWGIADPMNYKAGATINAPIKLTMPIGKKFKKIETGASTSLTDSYILALATDNTVWRYSRGNPTPFQITVPGETFRDIATLGGNAQVLLTNSDKLFAAGYLSSYAGTVGNSSTFRNVTAAWTSAGMIFPIKELVGNSNTLHIIDANDHMFGSGSNVQGEVGTGVEYSPYRIAGPQGGVFGYGFSNGLLLTAPVQIQGKFKNINTSTTITFYLYAQDLGDNWYSWGRNKAFSLGNGRSLGPYAGWGGTGDYAAYPNAADVPMPKRINPATVVWTLQNFSPTANIPPVVGAGINQYIAATSTTLYGKAFQQEQTIASQFWTKVSGPAGGTLASPTSLNTNISSLQTGVYVYRLSATNSNGQTSTDDVSVIVNVGNTPPVANAGNDTLITFPTDSTTLNGSATDADGTITSYSWRKISGPLAGIFNNPNLAIASVLNLLPGVYQYEITATDNDGATGKDTVSVTLNLFGNQAPTANAGVDANITLPTNSAPLNGSGTDADGTISSYQWTKIAGPTAGIISNATAAVTTATGLVQGVYRFELRVTDNNVATGRDTMQVTVNAANNQAPTANAGLDANITLPTNTASLNGSGTDADGSIASYQWTKIAGPTAGTISNATAAITTATGLLQGVYRFELRVTDNNGAVGRDTMQVTVNTAINQVPTANAGLDANITLPTNTASLNGSGTDADGTISSYQWTKIAGPTAGTISNATAAITAATGLLQGVYRFELRVTDNNGAIGRDTMQVTVNAANNQAPTANAGLDANITLPTNTASLNGSGTDADGSITSYQWTKIAGPTTGTISNATAAVTTATGLVQGVYRFELRVTDNNGAIDRDTMQVTVNAANNQAPTANAGLDANITLPMNAASLNGSGTDADGSIASYQWTKIAGPTTGTISNATAAVTTATGLLQGVYRFELRVTDNNGATDTDTMQVTVNAANNQAPTANAGLDANITLPTNTASLNGSGTDADGSIASYQWTKIAGPTTGTISNATVAITTATGLLQGVYRFELRVTDNNGAIDRDTMQVTVNAASNQAPRANAGLDANITLPTNTTALNGSGTDADGTISSYQWTKIAGPTAGSISNATAAVTSATGLLQGIYRFELRVTDNNGAIGRDTMQVTVNAATLNQAPVANAGGPINIYLPADSAQLIGSGSDADGIIVSYRWSILSAGGTYIFSNPNAAQTKIGNLQQGVYSIQLAVTDNRGGISYDTTLLSVGASRQSITEEFVNVYPNPVSSTLNVAIETTVSDEPISMTLFDSKGAFVSRKMIQLSGNTKLETMDMAGNKSGVYFLHIAFANKKQIVKKIVKL